MVRRAISKKKAKEIEKERQAFVHGDPERGIAGLRGQRHRRGDGPGHL